MYVQSITSLLWELTLEFALFITFTKIIVDKKIQTWHSNIANMGGTRVDIYRAYNQLPPFRSVSSHLDSPVRFRMFDFMRFSKQILTILD